MPRIVGAQRGGGALHWSVDWLWGLPLVVLTIVGHVYAIVLGARALSGMRATRAWRTAPFVVLVASAALTATVLVSLEAMAWAALYLWLGALPDSGSAILYSLGAITSYGHAEIFLQERWRLLGAIEAVNGLILFGLTTAFLFAFIERIWPLRGE